MLSTGAFNALLKTLEEPPEHVKFILATTEPQKLPTTILSRCQRFDFKKIPEEDIIKRLKIICEEAKINISESAYKIIAVLLFLIAVSSVFCVALFITNNGLLDDMGAQENNTTEINTTLNNTENLTNATDDLNADTGDVSSSGSTGTTYSSSSSGTRYSGGSGYSDRL